MTHNNDHGRPDCLFEQLLTNPNDDRQKVGVVLAYAFDGFPILSPYVCTDAACSSVTKLRSSWQHVADVTNAWDANAYVERSGDLDRCNGRYAEDGTYAYYATDTFPYFLGCYIGAPETRNPNPMLAGGNVEGGGGPGGQGRPDLQAAADKLGITRQELEQAQGPPPPDLAAAAQKLGIGEQALRDALGVP